MKILQVSRILSRLVKIQQAFSANFADSIIHITGIVPIIPRDKTC